MTQEHPQEQPRPEQRPRVVPRSPVEEGGTYFPDDRPAKKSMNMGGMGGIILNVIVAVVVVFAFSMFQGWVGQSQYRSDITRLESDLVVARQQITTQGDATLTAANKANADVTTLKASVTDLQNKATQSVTTITALQSSLNSKLSNESLTALINSMGLAKAADLSAAQAQVTALQTELTALKAKVTALEATQTAGSGTTVTGQSGSIQVVVDTLGNMPMSVTGIPNATTVSSMFRVKLTNTSTKTLTNISLQATIVANQTMPTMAAGYPSLTGTLVPWVVAQQSGGIMMFVNGWGMGATGLSLAPGASTTLYPSLTLQAAGAGAWNTTQYLFSPSVSVNSYDVQ